MVDPNDRQGRNRPATTSEKRIGLGFCVLLLILLLCAGCAGPLYYPRSEIPKADNRLVCLNVTMTEALEQSQQLCRDEFGVTAISCAEYPRGDLYPQRMIFWRPVDFNDNETMKAIGHEFIHVLGGKHE